ncbi:MAG: hypothetical protein AAGA60_21805 [Cyanobacteria bacterium P01_E01_bin.42]
MSEIPLCSIIVSSNLPVEEIDALETSLRMSSIQVQKPPSRVMGADDIVFIAAILGGLASAANLIDYGVKVAKIVNNWRKKLRERGQKPIGKLEHPDRLDLDLNAASDEEVEKWFNQL